MRIESRPEIQARSWANIPDTLSRLDIGDTIRAKILEITADEVFLKLFDGTLLRASTPSGLDAESGQMISLSVSSKTEGTLFLELLKDPLLSGGAQTTNLKDILTSLQIEPEAISLDLAAGFLKMGLPITKDRIDLAQKVMESRGGITVENAVFLVVEGLETIQTESSFLNDFLKGGIKMGEQLDLLAYSLESIQQMQDLKGERLSEIVEPLSQSGMVAETEKEGNISTPGHFLKGTAAEEISVKTAEPLPRANGSFMTDSKGVSGVRLQAEKHENLPEISNKIYFAEDGPESTETHDTGEEIHIPAADLFDADSKTEANNAGTFRADMGFPEETPGGANDGMIEKNPGQSPIRDRTDHSSRTDSGRAKDNSIPDSIKNLTKNIFISAGSRESVKSREVNNYYNDLNHKLSSLKTVISQYNEEANPGIESVSDIIARVDDTLSLLNQFSNNGLLYYQLPISLYGHKSTAEIYILKRDHNKKRIDPHNAIVFFSLDTFNMGRIETLLDFKGNNISLLVKSEKKQISEFIRDNIKDLYTGLADCGYKLVSTRYSLVGSAFTLPEQRQQLAQIRNNNTEKVDIRI